MVKNNIIYSAENSKSGRDYDSHSDLVITVGEYLRAAEVFHWFDRRQAQLFVRGKYTPRHKRTEVVLKRLADKKKLRCVTYPEFAGWTGENYPIRKWRKVYALSKKTQGDDEFVMFEKIAHGLAASETLLRFYLPFWKNEKVEIFPEKDFRGYGAVPEWGIRYPMGALYLGEFSTLHDFEYTGKMIGKIRNYKKCNRKFRAEFGVHPQIAFVVDVGRERLKLFARRFRQEITDNLNFCDYRTFLKADNVLSEAMWITNTGEEVALGD